jgi:hypothetical protein
MRDDRVVGGNSSVGYKGSIGYCMTTLEKHKNNPSL